MPHISGRGTRPDAAATAGAPGVGGSGAGSAGRRFKRENKNRPAEASSKQRPKRLQEVVEGTKRCLSVSPIHPASHMHQNTREGGWATLKLRLCREKSAILGSAALGCSRNFMRRIAHATARREPGSSCGNAALAPEWLSAYSMCSPFLNLETHLAAGTFETRASNP